MASRLVPSASAIHPWAFPLLDGAAAEIAGPHHANGAAGPPLPAVPEEAAPPVDERAIAALVEERAAEGYAEGLQRGFDEGREKAYAEGLDAARVAEERLAEQARRLVAIVDRLGAPIAALQRPVEEAVVALALEIARCVIGSEVSRSHEYLVKLIGEAIARVPIEMGAARVLLNPSDLDLVRALAPEIDKDGAVLVADETVEAGGCLVVADGEGAPVEDRRWYPRSGEGVSQVDLTLASRWRSVILTLFDGEGN